MESLLHKLLKWSQEDPYAPIHAYKRDKKWQFISTQECVENIENLAQFLEQIGVTKGDVGVILSYNCSEWIQMDLALMLTGAMSAGAYTNSSKNTIHHIINHSEAKLLFIDSYENYLNLYGEQSINIISPSVNKVILLKSPSSKVTLPEFIITFENALELGKINKQINFSDRLKDLKMDDTALLIYTSGTTGVSKGVCLSHNNLSFASQCYAQSWEAPKIGRLFSFLPLAHVAERITNLGIGIGNRYTVYFCSDPLSIASEMKEAKPTIAIAVPRLWDKFREGCEKRISSLSLFQQIIIIWSMKMSHKYWNKKINSKLISQWLKLNYSIANLFILKKLRQQLGLENSLRVVSGAATLSKHTLEWYRGIGVIIIEAYALTESSGVLTCGRPNLETKGTVGLPYDGIEIRIADDGEIQTRGPHVFKGYYKDEAASTLMLCDGWLLTGDLGEKDSNGFLKIIGRKREIIKTAEGKMVSPLYLETQIDNHPWIDQSVVIGDNKPYLSALITLNDNVNKLKLSNSEIRENIQEFINNMNLELASHERIKQFRILTHHFSIERDESTTTMKIKRKVIENNYNKQVDSMY